MTYKDFDLIIERAPDGFRARVINSPGGTATVDFRLPFSDLEIENVLLRLGRSRRLVRRAESSELQTAKSFGAALFNAICTGEIEACLGRGVAEVKRLGAGLRVRLQLADPRLADLPWEYLYSPSVNRFVALSIRTPLVRYIDLPEPILPVAVKPPIRVLVMISSPADYPQLDVDAEWRRLNHALADLVRSNQLEIDRLDNATLSALQKQLRKSQYHIFHFIGHGEFDQQAQEGVLVLHNDQGRGHRIGSQYLGMLLHDHASLRVAILNACEGARTSIHDPFAGSAQALVQQGIPAVIAMQFEIADDVASTFAHEFYGALSDGYPIDASLTEARKALFAAGHDVEWATPVLYMRAPDGRIFELDRQPARAVQETEETAGRVTSLIRDAGVALAHGKYEDALKHLRVAQMLDPDAPNLHELVDTAHQQLAVAETRARLRREVRAHVAAAADLLATADHAGAEARLREALKLRANDPEALALQARIRAHVPSQAVATVTVQPAEAATPLRDEAGGERQSAPIDREEDLLD